MNVLYFVQLFVNVSLVPCAAGFVEVFIGKRFEVSTGEVVESLSFW